MPLLALIAFVLIVLIVIFISLLLLRTFYSVDKLVGKLGEKKKQKEAIRLAELKLESQKSRQQHEKEIASLEALGLDAKKLGITEQDTLEH